MHALKGTKIIEMNASVLSDVNLRLVTVEQTLTCMG